MASALYVAQSLPTTDTFTDLLSGGEVTITSGEGLYVLDEGGYYRYDPSDPDADANGYVTLPGQVLLEAEKDMSGGVASIRSDGLLTQQPDLVTAQVADLSGIGGQEGVTVQAREFEAGAKVGGKSRGRSISVVSHVSVFTFRARRHTGSRGRDRVLGTPV